MELLEERIAQLEQRPVLLGRPLLAQLRREAVT
jgi:hypothetical protein